MASSVLASMLDDASFAPHDLDVIEMKLAFEDGAQPARSVVATVDRDALLEFRLLELTVLHEPLLDAVEEDLLDGRIPGDLIGDPSSDLPEIVQIRRDRIFRAPGV